MLLPHRVCAFSFRNKFAIERFILHNPCVILHSTQILSYTNEMTVFVIPIVVLVIYFFNLYSLLLIESLTLLSKCWSWMMQLLIFQTGQSKMRLVISSLVNNKLKDIWLLVSEYVELISSITIAKLEKCVMCYLWVPFSPRKLNIRPGIWWWACSLYCSVVKSWEIHCWI